METDKLAIAKILSDRKKETCVICLNGMLDRELCFCAFNIFILPYYYALKSFAGLCSLAGPRNHVAIPCGHKIFCGGCGPVFVTQHCPMCRVPVQSVIKVFG
jgi:hypothetical protein